MMSYLFNEFYENVFNDRNTIDCNYGKSEAATRVDISGEKIDCHVGNNESADRVDLGCDKINCKKATSESAV